MMSILRLSASWSDRSRLRSQSPVAFDFEDEAFGTPEGFPVTAEQESGDDEEMDNISPGTVDTRDYNEENEEEDELLPTEKELGIRRSCRAKGAPIEDLCMSDIILDPDGTVAYYWLGIVCIAVIYNIAVIILRLAFREMREEMIQGTVFYFSDTISDLIYFLDILVHCRMSFFQEGCLVVDPAQIVAHYTNQRRFYLDCLAVFPLGTVAMFFLGSTNSVLVRIPRLLKYSSMVKFFDLTDSRTRNPNWIRAFKLSLNLWIVIHWIGCVYFMLSEYEGFGTNDWVYPAGKDFDIFSRKYIRVMYWSLMTLTTIGERPSPETDLEYVFTGLTFLIGVFVFAAVVGNVGDVISNMNAARQEFQARMDQIKFYLQHRDVPEKLQNRVKRWADYTWSRTQAIDEPTLLQMLPDRLRTEIAINVHLETLKKVKLFEECEEGLLRELVLKLRPQIYSPGDYICRKGEIGREMFIVNHGQVQILIPSGESTRRTVIATLHPGNYFGEISLLKLDEGQNRRTADVRAVGYSELLRLSRKDLLSALVEYPNAKKILESQAKERMKKNKEVGKTNTDSSPSPSPPDTARDEEERPRKKKDALLNLIKSPNFKKLLSPSSDDLTETRQLLQELRSFDSQATKREMEKLKRERDSLRRKLNRALLELGKLRRRPCCHASKNGSSCLNRMYNDVQEYSPDISNHAASQTEATEVKGQYNDGSSSPTETFSVDGQCTQCHYVSQVNGNHLPDTCRNGVPNLSVENKPKRNRSTPELSSNCCSRSLLQSANSRLNESDDPFSETNCISKESSSKTVPTISVTSEEGEEQATEEVVNDLLALELDSDRDWYDSDRFADSCSETESDRSEDFFDNVE